MLNFILSSIIPPFYHKPLELTTYDLVSRGDEAGEECRGTFIEDDTTKIGWGPGYGNSCIHSGDIKISDDGKLATVWYNYALASAGTIIDENTTQQNPATNNTPATESVCPKGWTLPDYSQVGAIGNGTSRYVTIFSPVLGGMYRNSLLTNETTDGYWWSSSANSNKFGWRHVLHYIDGRNALARNNYTRYYGFYIRCVQKST